MSLKDDILKSIELSGSVSEESKTIKPQINKNLDRVIDKSSGKKRLRPAIVNKFNILLTSSASLSAMNPFEIRCLNCNRIISYPCWHWASEYAVNIFHYFLCYNGKDKPGLDCR